MLVSYNYSPPKTLLSFFCFILSFSALGQNDLPDTRIKTLAGEEVIFSSVSNSDTLVIVSIWATWCIPCTRELEAISERYEEWQKEKPFRLMAISIDDSRTAHRVKAFVKGRGWPFDIYLDTNSDLKRALNINDVPYTLLIKKGKIIYQHSGYIVGNEEELFEKLISN